MIVRSCVSACVCETLLFNWKERSSCVSIAPKQFSVVDSTLGRKARISVSVLI